ncbi:nuclear receptor-interacting protein 3 isoform X2 [Ambystoma mexicanum]|uniref:nuclear receptor-interacting protein 3 isoform X2 n=1 Tax=Ambystoma mexicanum TaxID=8296 RepID=UPI0037E8660D
MFYSGVLTDSGRKEAELREVASLRQQRRMKQAVQFIHKDSADLLPLDGLKKLGTSKDTQPHNILQRRLLETNLSRFRNNRTAWTPKNDQLAQSKKLNHVKPTSQRKIEEDVIFVCCQCAGKDMKVRIDTGCQYNLITSACVDRLGLKERVKTNKNEDENISLPQHVKTLGQVEHLTVTMGALTVDCSAVVIEDNEKSLSFGVKLLRSLKCVINLEKNNIEFGRTEREAIPFVDNSSILNEPNSSDK